MYAPRWNWDSPQPPTRRLVCSLPPVSGGRVTLVGEKGVGRVPIPTRGIHCGTLYMYVLCGNDSVAARFKKIPGSASASKKFYILTPKIVSKLSEIRSKIFIPEPDPGS